MFSAATRLARRQVVAVAPKRMASMVAARPAAVSRRWLSTAAADLSKAVNAGASAEQFKEMGLVTSIGDGVAKVVGLSNIQVRNTTRAHGDNKPLRALSVLSGAESRTHRAFSLFFCFLRVCVC